MTASWRTSAIADRHRALGSALEDWNGMGTAWRYAKDMQAEHVAIRTKAGLMDVSGLKKVHVTGPDATAVLTHATTRNLDKVYPGKSVYAAMLNDAGYFTEDCVCYRLSPNSWLLVHGTGSGQEEIARSAVGRNVSIRFDDDLHNLSLQGPLAVEFLARHIPGIHNLNYFHHLQTTLFGRHVMVSRTGYTGERGYELFMGARDAGHIWDTILDEGRDLGIVPCCFSVLDLLRVESYLLFYPYDNSATYPYETPDSVDGDSLWELGLDFTVSPGKTGFRGAERHYALKGRERIRIFGVLVDAAQGTEPGDELWADGRKVGVITYGMFSTLTKRSMAIARLAPSHAVHGTKLEVRGRSVSASAIAHTLPFDDPEKKKRTAIGRG